MTSTRPTPGPKKSNASRKGQEANSAGIKTPIEDSKVVEIYNNHMPFLKSLSDEVRFAIESTLSSNQISYSSLEVRVKTLESTLKKVKDKQYEEFSQLTDLVGARVICPFRSNLDEVKQAISDTFDIREFDDKAIDDPNKFGYMSLHFLCYIKDEHCGPRYDSIKNIPFEIQIRTICMHAWSSIQHSLEYKGEWDVPMSLRKDINALSALFYLADSQFESVFKAKIDTLQTATTLSRQSSRISFANQELNLETLRAYANFKFPGLGKVTTGNFSELMRELDESGYKSIGEIDRDVERGLEAANAENAQRSSNYNSVGMIRVSISYASTVFRDITYGDEDSLIPEFMNLVKN